MSRIKAEIRRTDAGFVLTLPLAAIEHLGFTPDDASAEPLDVVLQLNEGIAMTVHRLHTPGRIHIADLEGSSRASAKKAPAAAPFSTRSLVPEDLGTEADKGRDDLVQVRDNDGALKMTRTNRAEVRRVRKAPSNELPMAAFTGPAAPGTRKK